MTRAPSRGTSDTPSIRPRAARACPRPGPSRRPPPPRSTSRQGCPGAAEGRRWTRARDGSYAADERQRGHTRGKLAAVAPDPHGRARRRVLAPDEAERDWAPQLERAHGARDPADFLTVRDDRRARPRDRLALEREPRQESVDVAAVAHADDDLLPDVAALGVRDERLERHLGQERRVIHVVAEPRRAGLHAQRLERGETDRLCARGEDRLPERRAVFPAPEQPRLAGSGLAAPAQEPH